MPAATCAVPRRLIRSGTLQRKRRSRRSRSQADAQHVALDLEGVVDGARREVEDDVELGPSRGRVKTGAHALDQRTSRRRGRLDATGARCRRAAAGSAVDPDRSARRTRPAGGTERRRAGRAPRRRRRRPARSRAGVARERRRRRRAASRAAERDGAARVPQRSAGRATVARRPASVRVATRAAARIAAACGRRFSVAAARPGGAAAGSTRARRLARAIDRRQRRARPLADRRATSDGGAAARRLAAPASVRPDASASAATPARERRATGAIRLAASPRRRRGGHRHPKPAGATGSRTPARIRTRCRHPTSASHRHRPSETDAGGATSGTDRHRLGRALDHGSEDRPRRDRGSPPRRQPPLDDRRQLALPRSFEPMEAHADVGRVAAVRAARAGSRPRLPYLRRRTPSKARSNAQLLAGDRLRSRGAGGEAHPGSREIEQRGVDRARGGAELQPGPAGDRRSEATRGGECRQRPSRDVPSRLCAVLGADRAVARASAEWYSAPFPELDADGLRGQAAHLASDQERHLERLLVVEARIDLRSVVAVEIDLGRGRARRRRTR